MTTEFGSLLTRRDVLQAATAAVALLATARLTPRAHAQSLASVDATYQAFCDTILPGRTVARTATGGFIAPGAILGLDPDPGGVEADALLVAQHPLVGAAALIPPFVAELEARSVPLGGPFLGLDMDRRVTAVKGGLAYDNASRQVWEAAAAIPFIAFCAAAIDDGQTAETAVGYRVMGLPGRAPLGYRRTHTYGRRLSRERTRSGSLA